MKWTDVSDDDGIWTIATEARVEETRGSLQLPELALQIIRSLPRFAGNEFIFAGRESGSGDARSAKRTSVFSRSARRCRVLDLA